MAVSQQTASSAGLDPAGVFNGSGNTQGGDPIMMSRFVVNESLIPPPTEILWELRNRGQGDTLPVLVRYGSQVSGTAGFQTLNSSAGLQKIYTGVIKAVDPIDVVSNFPWTKSPKTARFDVPTIRLTERRLLMNSNISNIANSVFATNESVGAITTFAKETFGSLLDQKPATPIAQNSAVFKIASAAINAIKDVGTNITANLQEIGKKTVEYTETHFDTFNNPALQPYNFLYATEPTGFVYDLPYFNNAQSSLSNSFGEGESNLASGITSLAKEFAQEVASIANVVKPGTYIEKAKQYSFGDKGRTVEIKFPLLNTGNYADISRNWQFIYGLTYQNRPGRVSRSIIDMPVIYQAEVKGMLYMPYAFISNLSVSFLGNRRTMRIQVPVYNDVNQTKLLNLTTIIPDAYEISITIEGMNEETRNFMFASTNSTGVTVNGRS